MVAYWMGEKVEIIQKLPAQLQGIRPDETPEPFYIIIDGNGVKRTIAEEALQIPAGTAKNSN